MGGGERKGRDIDVSGISGYMFFKSLDELDGIADEESKCAILVLVILVAIFHKEMCTHLDLLHSKFQRRNSIQILQTHNLQPL